ncbi:MAG TPA: RNA polymerase sigma factor [Crocinitomicaceae bacterium]|nr:RNA polymerase sigma factor [Crocinitomicaceae bacterium]
MSKEKQDRFLRLYEPIHDRFERFCRARVYGRMDYKDLINETLMVAFHKLDTLRSETTFLSFLFTISVRVLANHHKKKKEYSISESDNYNLEDKGDSTAYSTEVYYLHQALSKLPEVQKEAIILYEISGFSIKEIATIQDASEPAVKQRLKRGREKLVEILNYEAITKKEETNG